MLLVFQRLAYRADASVHHVAGRDDVHTRGGLHQGLLDEDFDGGLVQHVAGGVDHAILPVAGIRVEGDVGEHAEFGSAFSSPTTRGIRPSGLAASMPSGVLRAGSMAGNSDGTRDAQLDALLGHGQQRVERVAHHARQRGHGLLYALPSVTKTG